jgi:hypothetical protein
MRNSIEALPLGDGWTLVVNVLGFRATEYPKLRRLSVNGRALVVYEDVELTPRSKSLGAVTSCCSLHASPAFS